MTLASPLLATDENDSADNHSRSLPRSDGSGGGLSHSTIIIIAACASVGAIVFLAFLLRLLCRRSALKPAPLPPPQPLAHHRELRVAEIEASKRAIESWGSNAPQTPHIYSPYSSSNASLLGGKDGSPLASPVYAPSPRRVSLMPSQSGMSTDDGDEMYMSPLEATDLSALPPPNPPFTLRSRSSSTSLQYSEPETSPDASSSTYSHGGGDAALRQQTHVRDPSHALSQTRSVGSYKRAPSVSSSHASTLTSQGPVRRGPRNTDIQIVLPSPLAPSLDNRSLSTSASPSHESHKSVVDQWTPGPFHPPSTDPRDIEATGYSSPARLAHAQSRSPHRSRVNSSPSIFSHSLAPSVSVSGMPGPSLSMMPSSSIGSMNRLSKHSASPSTQSFPAEMLPPVPQIPSKYGSRDASPARPFPGTMSSLGADGHGVAFTPSSQ
ncbi:hypothetical protein FISHEDRAFT_61088 [Fistulina hepatica ATCC 64428]|uniref:Uncharacterized protein n=1 Tax=Fistulina hepatica ATCC 64428 TaxID=1128425 RepID=A0A0D7A4Q5_9AGAR|nr:hypothetical protein FISHEDRAFT_61088 [Fistulina hepatica ATCC 64428]